MKINTKIILRVMLILSAVFVPGCSDGTLPSDTLANSTASVQACDGACADSSSFLTTNDIEIILAQAISQAQALSISATIAVVDRVGNVLAVFRMKGADTSIEINSGRGVVGGLDGIAIIPDTLVAITKAITGAYLSSEGNAFTTRTASQIIQEHFNPQEVGQPGGPLFGVQFSNLPCSDLSTRFTTGVNAGPHRSPLGLSADAGGMPLYKKGTPVGGVGVITDGVYGVDLSITDFDNDTDEAVALAATFGFEAPLDRRADRITLDGKTLRYTDQTISSLATSPADAENFTSLNSLAGNLMAVKGYSDGSIVSGTAFGQAASGIRPDMLDYPGLDAFVLVDNNDKERFRPQAGTDGDSALTAAEVKQLVKSALKVANRSRAQIRRPLGSQARVSVSIVDTNGVILAIGRTRDGPIFGTDVSLQKARTAVFFSGNNAASDLQSAPDTIYLNADGSPSGTTIRMEDYVTAVRVFVNSPTALSGDAVAFSDRSGGNLSRPYYPDGITTTSNGPFSKPFSSWSPFSTGLQLDLVMNKIVQHIFFVSGVGSDTPQNCTGLTRLKNGIQIFPGSVPIYRGGVLVGGIGVSGDGVDQDDMISFLGVHEAGEILGTINNAPLAIRADNIQIDGSRLRYIQCPQSPYINSSEQNVCANK